MSLEVALSAGNQAIVASWLTTCEETWDQKSPIACLPKPGLLLIGRVMQKNRPFRCFSRVFLCRKMISYVQYRIVHLGSIKM